MPKPCCVSASGAFVGPRLAQARSRRKRQQCCAGVCCAPPAGTEITSTFQTRFNNTVDPFVVLVQGANSTIVTGASSVEITAISIAVADTEAVIMESLAAVLDSTTDSFCLSFIAAVDAPLQSPAIALPIPAAVVGLTNNGTDSAAIVYDYATGRILLASGGPVGFETFDMGPVDGLQHTWVIAGSAATQSYTVSKDGGPTMTFTPAGGNYPQSLMAAVMLVSAESPDGATVQNRLTSPFYCVQAGPSVSGSGARYARTDRPEHYLVFPDLPRLT